MRPEVERHVELREGALEKVRRILIDNLRVRREPDEIDPDAPLFGTGLGLDSIDAVELMVSVESEFKVRLDNSLLRRMRTVNHVVDFVLEMQEARRVA